MVGDDLYNELDLLIEQEEEEEELFEEGELEEEGESDHAYSPLPS